MLSHICSYLNFTAAPGQLPFLYCMEIERPLFLRGTPGRLTKMQKIRYALALLKLRNEHIERGEDIPRQLSYAAIANRVGVCI